MELKEAVKLANTYFKNTYSTNVNMSGILDAVTHWIFYPGQDDIVEFGIEGVKIEKNTGKMESFILPDDKNFELLDHATKVKLEA